ncbi:MAG TPA: acyl-CoA dehydrogenase family protein [Candidatus Polarisedimenticolia bacterium]|nr:acyl-CoA dehydrogenase family protein [Candidatus Polarisedimenticolia bacterium]
MTPTTRDHHEARSFMRSLFEGRIEDDLVFPFPAIPEDERENLEMLLDSVRRFASRSIDARAIDEREELPREVLSGMAELGLFGLTIPEAHGGFGLSLASYGRVMSELASHCGATAATLGAHLGIGCKGIVLFGTEEQKRRWLPACASGETIAAFCLTEPTSGSDAASITARGELDPATGEWVLNGTKQWITNGGIAGLYTVFVQTETARKERAMSAFVVTRGTPGLGAGKPEKKMGLRGSSTTDVVLENVRVPASAMLGERGAGFKMAMEILNQGRLSLAAACAGPSRALIERSAAFAKGRKAFDRTVADFEMIKAKFAEMVLDTYAMEAMVDVTTALAARGHDVSLESALCKIQASEAMWRTVNHAVQINGGFGYMREYPFERVLRDARINPIFEGTNEILRLFVSLAGMQGPGRTLREVGKALGEPLAGLGVLTEYAARRLRRVIGSEKLEFAHPSLQREAGYVEAFTADLASSVEGALRRHGKSILEREYVQERVSDAAGDLYAMICCLSRATTAGSPDHLLAARGFCGRAWRRIRRSLRQIESNSDPDTTAVADLALLPGRYPFA